MFFDSFLLLQRWISLIEGGYWSSSLNGANRSVKMILMIMIIIVMKDKCNNQQHNVGY